VPLVAVGLPVLQKVSSESNMANGLFLPQFRGQGTPGSTRKGLALADIAQTGVQGSRDSARIDSIVQGAQQLKLISDPEGKLAFLTQRKQELEAQGLPANDTDEGIALLQAGDLAGLEEITDQAISFGQPGVSAKEQAETGLKLAQTEKTIAETKALPLAAREKNLAKDVAASKTKFEQATKIRTEITKASVDFDKIIGAFDRINAAAKDPSAAGDLALVFNFMKMLDPGSTVREGEFATAAKAAGLGERFIQLAEKVDSGEILSKNQRKDFTNQAEKLFKASKKRNDQTVESFVKLANRNDIDREDVVIERGEALKEGDELEEGAIITNPTTKQRMQVVNGELVEIQ